MKPTYIVLLFAASASAIDIGPLLNQPSLKKGKCFARCYVEPANNLECPSGPLATLCSGLDQIKREGTKCAAKCGSGESIQS